MENTIETTPVKYAPKMDSETRLYSDQHIFDFTKGVICPCTAGKTFNKKSSFQNHQKTKRHLSWIQNLNDNATNFYLQTLQQENVIKSQQLLLTRLDIQLKQKATIIEYYENKYLHNNIVSGEEADLLNFVD
jgi:hypothetical protein